MNDIKIITQKHYENMENKIIYLTRKLEKYECDFVDLEERVIKLEEWQEKLRKIDKENYEKSRQEHELLIYKIQKQKELLKAFNG